MLCYKRRVKRTWLPTVYSIIRYTHISAAAISIARVFFMFISCLVLFSILLFVFYFCSVRFVCCYCCCFVYCSCGTYVSLHICSHACLCNVLMSIYFFYLYFPCHFSSRNGEMRRIMLLLPIFSVLPLDATIFARIFAFWFEIMFFLQ